MPFIYNFTNIILHKEEIIMTYKKSQYNVLLNSKHYKNANGEMEYPIFNTATGCFGAMDEKTSLIYNATDKLDLDEIYGEHEKEQIGKMIQHGFLVESDLDELLKIKLFDRISRYDNSVLSITIAPTLDCNMDCPYCFEQKNGHVMGDEVQNAIIEFVKGHTKTITSLFITWYGGEPLLEVSIIQKLSKAFIEICEENKIFYSANIITNGYYLTEETAKILKEDCHLNYAQVTVDGCGETHNKRRHLKNGEPSFDQIIDNIEASKKYFFVSIRSNVDKENISDAKRLIDYLFIERKWRDEKNLRIYFSPVRSDEDAVGSCYTRNGFSSIHNDLMGYLFTIGAHSSVTATIPKPISHACGGVSTYSMVIDPDGDIYKCYEIIGQKNHVVGDVFNGYKYDNYLQKWLLLDMSPECEGCKFLPMCQSACPLKRLDSNKKNCYHMSLTYKKALEIAYSVHTLKKLPSSTPSSKGE